MKKNFTLTFALLLCLFWIGGNAQTQFWSDTFEDTGAPSSGSRTASTDFSCGGPPFTSYFTRTLPTGIALQNGAYSSFQGSKIWAGEDIDRGPTCTNLSISANQQVTWSGINITGKTGLSFKGLLAASNIGGWQGLNFGTAEDFLVIEYRIDGGAWKKALAFYSNVPAASPASSNQLYLDTDGDLIGDGAGLNYAFTEYSADITETGATLDLRFNCHANAGAAQELAVDNFRLFETPPCVTPVITGNPPNRTICAGSNTTFPSSATGATGYQWQVNTGSGFTDLANGAPYSGVTTNTLTITGATAGMSGYLYRSVAYNTTTTCFTNSNQATLTVSSISTATGSQTNVSCFGGTNGSASVTPSGGIAPYSYSWSPSGGTGATASGLAAGTYTVTVTDNITCTATRTFTITQPAAAVSGTTVVTNVSCFGGTNGTINLTPTGGTGPYTFNWGGGVTTEDRTGLATGTYSVTITDNNGCTGTVSGISVTQPAAAVSGTTVVTNVSCFGGTNGTINLTPTGGTGPYTFNWGGGVTTEDRTGLATGTYSVTITDNNGCTGTVSGISVTQPVAAVSGTTVVTNVSCFGGTNGTINLTPTGGTGPYTFNWGGGVTTEDRTGLATGTYSVTITDNNGCTGTVSGISVTQPVAAVSGTTVVTNVSCFGGTNGTINLTPTGGTGPYTFNWGGGVTTEDRTGLATGTYSVTITDNNGCTGTVSGISVTQPVAAVSGTTVVTNVSCFGGTNGTINLTPTGGTGPYTFNWGGGVTTEDRTGLATGTYSVTITDNNGCTGTVSGISVTQPVAAVSGTTVVTNVSCFGGTNGTINLTPTGGTGPYTFNWGGGVTTEDRTGLATGTYSVTITDNNGCTGTVSGISVTQPVAAVSGTTVITNVSCFGGTNGTINLTPTGGTGPYTFNWGGGVTTEDRTGLATGTYSVTITDNNGCTGTVSGISVTQPVAAVSGTTMITNVSCFGGTNGTINLTPTGGTGPYTFNWGGGVTTEDRTGLATGTYSVTITDNNGCTGTVSGISVTQPAAINLTTTLVGATITANQVGATYQWFECPSTIISGETGQSFTPTVNGSYGVTITIGGCSVTSSCVLVNTLANPDFEEKSKFIMYPNPSKGIVNIECDSDGDLNIINQLGQTIKTVKVSSNRINTINIEGLADGIYFITEKKDSKLITHKLVLKK